MRFLSLFQHDSSKPLPRTGGSSGEDLMLALKQRARRRLVGAVVLVVATVITLPLIFDSGQKKGEARTPNIAHTQPILSAPSQAVVTQAQSLIETDQSTVRGVQRKTAQGDVSLQSGRALSTGANVRDMATTSLSDGEIVMQDTRVEGHKKEIGSASSVPLAVKFSIKAGAFASEERARNWVAKLKAEKLPVRVELKKMSDGELYLLRVGPFLSRAAAHVAQKKIQALGLPGVISESH